MRPDSRFATTMRSVPRAGLEPATAEIHFERQLADGRVVKTSGKTALSCIGSAIYVLSLADASCVDLCWIRPPRYAFALTRSPAAWCVARHRGFAATAHAVIGCLAAFGAARTTH
jgi:hypothetical protein